MAALDLDEFNKALIDQGKLQNDRAFLISVLNLSVIVN